VAVAAQAKLETPTGKVKEATAQLLLFPVLL
jgi:hypothetical protein